MAGRGDGSRMVRWSVPPCDDDTRGEDSGWNAEAVRVVGDGGGGVAAEVSVRWHSLSIDGMDDARRRAGSEKAWMLLKILEAYGSWAVGPGTARG